MKKHLISEQQYAQLKLLSEDVSMDDLHSKIFDIYIEIKAICEKHNLQYFAEGGTWVGAALCGGFIPWDDDMDIRMPRADYERFSIIAKDELPHNIQALDCTRDPYSAGNMLKVHDTSTTFIESTKRLSPNQWTGVFVDIVPFDNAPDSDSERSLLQKKGTKLFISSILRKKNHINVDILNYKNTWWYSLFESNDIAAPRGILGVCLFYLYLRAHPVNYFSKKLDKLWQNYPDNSKLITCPERPWEKEGRILYLPREYYGSAISMDFCDSKMPVPVGYEEISLMSYGFKPTLDVDDSLKYKHLDGAIVDLDKPFKWYQDRV